MYPHENIWEEASPVSTFSAVCLVAIVVSAIVSIAVALGAILILAYRELMLVLATLPAE
jgi:hypothetical protein